MGARFESYLRASRYCCLIAVANLAQRPVRLTVALLGTSAALLLLLLQISFLVSVRAQASALYSLFDFDIALVPSSYQILVYTGTLDRVRLSQARSVDGVVAATALNVANGAWNTLPAHHRSNLLIFGVDEADDFIEDPALRSGLAALNDNRSVLIDDYSAPSLGALATGTAAEILGQRVVIAGHYRLGLFFYADGSVFVRNSTFSKLTGRPPRDFAVGLLRLAKGADPYAIKADLAKALPDDVQIYLHDELIQQERDFFTVTKPIGVMLEAGMVIAFLVGAVILYQVLSTEISRRLNEHAVLKAMGFSSGFLYGIGLLQVAVLALGGFCFAVAVAAPLLWGVKAATHLPTGLSVWLLLVGLGAALSMSIGSAAIVLHRVARADPAALF
jgi:putative ABC transport system permease protein